MSFRSVKIIVFRDFRVSKVFKSKVFRFSSSLKIINNTLNDEFVFKDFNDCILQTTNSTMKKLNQLNQLNHLNEIEKIEKIENLIFSEYKQVESIKKSNKGNISSKSSKNIFLNDKLIG